ncbi:MAG: hypothetical protein LBI05_05925 [Planctomycetaceae bacterium]|nr:hypothetical protein [Planctomycetaceae bacterium]
MQLNKRLEKRREVQYNQEQSDREKPLAEDGKTHTKIRNYHTGDWTGIAVYR